MLNTALAHVGLQGFGSAPQDKLTRCVAYDSRLKRSEVSGGRETLGA